MNQVFTPVPGKCNVFNPKRQKICLQVAGFGTDHKGVGPCKWHGGTLPVVKQAWAGRYVDYLAERELAQFGKPVRDADPEQTLLDLVSEAAGNVQWLSQRVASLASQDAEDVPANPQAAALQAGRSWSRAGDGYDQGSRLFGPVIDVDKDGNEHVVGEDVRAMVKLYDKWTDKLAKYAKAALDAGIEKRRVEMAESQGQTIVIVVNNVLMKLGLDPEQIKMARAMIADQFRELDAE